MRRISNLQLENNKAKSLEMVLVSDKLNLPALDIGHCYSILFSWESRVQVFEFRVVGQSKTCKREK